MTYKFVGKIQGGGKICRELITKLAVVDPTRVSKRKLNYPLEGRKGSYVIMSGFELTEA